MAAQAARQALQEAIVGATETLADAGIDSARIDAEELAAHLTGVERGLLAFIVTPNDEFFGRYRDLVAARSRRVPLQHLTGTAPFGPLMLHVGPGVFIPRPETEALLEWALKAVAQRPLPPKAVVADLCTGSGALAVSLAREWPDATVLAVDDSNSALAYARRNAHIYAKDSGLQFVEADVTAPDLLPQLDDRVDLLVANPPYIPDGAALEPEVAEHDPHHALFGGPDGMAVVNAIVELAARWLRPGGRFAVEHDDTTSAQTVELLRATGRFDEIVPRHDLAGRPRFVTATRIDQERR
ncbi:HemK/PrmC family methyltransferase [soil metagenome]